MQNAAVYIREYSIHSAIQSNHTFASAAKETHLHIYSGRFLALATYPLVLMEYSAPLG
jgi:hypothetical protein